MTAPALQPPAVAVIGGGCAGLAAATELAKHGVPVTLFESARQLGGRARGLNWKDRRLDNGQHILLGAYSETLRLLRESGADSQAPLLRLPLQLVQLPDFALRASARLPAPLHILAGLLRARGLKKRERLAAARFLAWLRLCGFRLAQDLPLGELLASRRQPEAVTRNLWEPICLAALNTPLGEASAQMFLNVLRDGFARAKADSDLLLPRRDFSALLAEPLAQAIRRDGGSVLTNHEITAIHRKGNGYEVICGDAAHAFSHVVLAVQPFRAAALLRELPELAAAARQCDSLDYQPIYTIYLQYPDTVRLPFPMLGLSGGHGQWVLDRGALDGQAGLLAVVISARGPHQNLTQEALAAAVTAQLAQALPHLPAPLWHKVIAEKRATFSCRPHLARPAQRTGLGNFLLAGDYTAGPYPATIEGAVRSGVQCAHLILESL